METPKSTGLSLIPPIAQRAKSASRRVAVVDGAAVTAVMVAVTTVLLLSPSPAGAGMLGNDARHI